MRHSLLSCIYGCLCSDRAVSVSACLLPALAEARTPLLPSTVSWGRFLHAVERRILAAVFVFAGSVSLANARTYAEKIEGIPYPTDQADWRKKCAWLRREISRQQNIASSGTTQPGTFSYETKETVEKKVARSKQGRE